MGRGGERVNGKESLVATIHGDRLTLGCPCGQSIGTDEVSDWGTIAGWVVVHRWHSDGWVGGQVTDGPYPGQVTKMTVHEFLEALP
jgi:hypothetical protein